MVFRYVAFHVHLLSQVDILSAVKTLIQLSTIIN